MLDSDARLEMEFVRRFVVLYQEVQPLTIGEIWALPVMLRWGILFVLTRTAGDITGLAPPVDGLRDPPGSAPRPFPQRRRGSGELLHQPADK